MRPHGSAAQLEARRLRALELLESGSHPQDVANQLGVTRRSVDIWRKKYRELGEEAILAKPHPGRACFLDDEQLEDLCERLVEGAVSQGFESDLWTCPRVQTLIEREYNVLYHVDHLPRLLRKLGFSPQKPQKRAVERDEERIATWIRKDWPRIKKRPDASTPTSFSLTKPGF